MKAAIRGHVFIIVSNLATLPRIICVTKPIKKWNFSFVLLVYSRRGDKTLCPATQWIVITGLVTPGGPHMVTRALM